MDVALRVISFVAHHSFWHYYKVLERTGARERTAQVPGG